jgi:hypothetical protein
VTASPSSGAPAGVPAAGQDPRERGVRLACEVCTKEFTVGVPVYRSLSGVVECPRCGSTDLVLLDPGDDAGPGPQPR